MNPLPLQHYCLRWNNHRSNLLNVFEELLENESFTDVTLAVDDGQIIKCHKIVLAACSSYFQTLFLDVPCTHPIVVLKDVTYTEIKAILQYMYRGEVSIAQDKLGGLLKVAEVLKVKGLIEEHRADGGEQERSMPDDPRVHQTCSPREDAVETSMSPPPSISTSTGNRVAAHSSDQTSPPHSTSGAYNTYGKSTMAISVDRPLPLGMWPLSALSMHSGISAAHQATSSSITGLGGVSSGGLRAPYDNGFENTLPISKRLRKAMQPDNDMPILRTVLDLSKVPDSSQAIPLRQSDNHESLHFHGSSNGSVNDRDNHRGGTDLSHGEAAHSSYTDVPFMNEDQNQLSYATDSKSDVKPVRDSRLEWKRYKQYTRDDIFSAIDAVKAGMSPVQAARKFNVPSRTLYDKVKKLGISTSRPFRRFKRADDKREENAV